MSTVHVAVLAFEGVSLFHLSVPAVAFGVVNRPQGFPDYEVRICASIPGQIKSDQGIVIDVPDGLEVMQKADVIIVPAWEKPEAEVPDDIIRALKEANQRGVLIIGFCLGAFVLGAAGLLNGKEATTHWMARDLFASRFPQVNFRPDVLYVADGNIVTSAGTVAALDCCLEMIRLQHGSDIANRMARQLVTPPHRPGGQAQYIERPVPQMSCVGRMSDVLEWARGHLSEPINVDTLADVAKMSRRTFTRRFRDTTGTTVTKWLNAERVFRAQQLLETTELPVECIAMEVGFRTTLSMRLQFSAYLHTSPSEYRRTFFRIGRSKNKLPE
ncbi:TPA: GlxA family transcriptional regulator [Raoultella ornithinolytica]|uniref:GlxA family transcriptional regulator n=1 Tax=Enterobacteriaceae TaxID=543 RepID=UPI000B494508|nr:MULTISPECIES: helix-turn-helix domain-containing protein [Enterobacteriaceae]MBN4035411.1 helix-turn-helix domain-containing protein [Citrobacter freundii]MBZ7625652.1 helix-turn-helix domain-containing protein [Klebsiella michiganensis]MCW9599807.1 helix-turn-helix domain-containing protein [Klebsiella michiganensis]MCW9644419.1 helix-turn-helix domain-containing protein [Klebsiella michiganensis]MEA8878239.1 helix-turn-helix domain-containing protein [Citrobacter freundii]